MTFNFFLEVTDQKYSLKTNKMSSYIFARRGYNGITRVDMEDYFDDVELESLYQWVDRVPLSRPKKNIGKDFSDGGRPK